MTQPAEGVQTAQGKGDGGNGRGRGNNASTPIIVGRGTTWIIGLILIPLAFLFLCLLIQLWPPPKPREGFSLVFERHALEVRPGSLATYAIWVYASSGFSEPVTLGAVVMPENLTYAFVPHSKEGPTTGLLVPSPTGSSAALTLQTPQTSPAEEKSYSIMVAATARGQTKTKTGSLVVKPGAPEGLREEAPKQDASEARTFREGFSDLTVLFWKFHVPDEMRLFLIVAVVGCLGGLLHSIRSFIWYAGHEGLERRWIPWYASTPIISMMMAIIFYLVFRAGFISPATPVAETNAYGFAAIAGLVGLFSANALEMLQKIAETIFTEVKRGGGTIPPVSPGDFNLTASGSPQLVAPGGTATYSLTVTATQDFSASVRLTAAVDPVRDKAPTVTFNPTALTPTTTTTPVMLTAITTTDTPPDAYNITITATGGGKEHTAEVTLTVTNGRGADGVTVINGRGADGAPSAPATTG